MDYQEISEMIDEAKAIKQKADALDKLMNHSQDFRNIILNGYLKDEAVRLVHLRGVNPEDDDELLRRLDAIAFLKQYFDKIFADRDIAIKSINDGNDAIEQLEE